MSKETIITRLKAEYPTIREGSEEVGYTELKAKEYEATIARWAEAELEIEEKQAELAKAEASKVTAKAKLEALGLTTDDLKALGL